MNKSKINRLKRIHQLEKKKLDSLVGELKGTQALLRQQQQHFDHARRKLDEVFTVFANQPTISQLQQASRLTAQIQSIIQNVQSDMDATNEKLQQQMNQVIDQRASVKGWEKLIDKKQQEAEAVVASQAMIEADDGFLRSTVGTPHMIDQKIHSGISAGETR